MAWIEIRGEKYRVYWDVGTPENRQRKVESFDTPEEADQHKKKIEYEASIGLCINPSKMTFGEYLDHWLKIHGAKLAPKTLVSYECEIKNHMKPQIGRIKLTKLSPMLLQNYYTDMLTCGKILIVQKRLDELEAIGKMIDKKDDTAYQNNRRAIIKAKARIEKMKSDGTGGLSSTTVNYHHRIIHKALKQAVKWQMVARNVADAVEAPPKNKTEIEYMKKSQVNKFISMIKDSEDYPVITTAIFTGMRQGELLGLRWNDVDLDTGIIKVRQQLQYTAKTGYGFKDPKRNSKRDIPISLPLNAILRKVRKEQERIKAIYEKAATADQGQSYKDFDLVFCNENGNPMDGTKLTKRFQSLLVQHGFNKIRFHSLRHTFATMCRAAGTNLEDVQDLLGHADISTTKNMYTHIEIEPLKKAIDMFTEYMES